MVNLPVEYTGTIIPKRGDRQIGGERSLINKMFGCKELYKFTFNDGKFVKTEKLNRLCKRIARLEKNKLKFIDFPINKDFIDTDIF